VADIDVCLIRPPTLILVVLAKKVGMHMAEAQVIAEAIAAFQVNNEQRMNWGLRQ
jgi:hypothetical protein